MLVPPPPPIVKAPIRRKANFSHNETIALVTGAQKRCSIIMAKGKNRAKIDKEVKHQAWMEILNEVNAVNNAPRDLRSIKKKLQSLKSEMKNSPGAFPFITLEDMKNLEFDGELTVSNHDVPCTQTENATADSTTVSDVSNNEQQTSSCGHKENNSKHSESKAGEIGQNCDRKDDTSDSMMPSVPEVLIGAPDDYHFSPLELQREKIAIMKEQSESLKKIVQLMSERNRIEREKLKCKRRRIES